MMESPEVFYMVYIQGGSNPVVCHSTRRSADQEAARLTESTGKKSYVLRAVGMFYSEQVVKPTYIVKGISIGTGGYNEF
jgi:hypothetical protein